MIVRLWRAPVERDYYVSAEEAIEYGLIDKILRPSQPKKPGAGKDGVHILRRMVAVNVRTLTKTVFL